MKQLSQSTDDDSRLREQFEGSDLQPSEGADLQPSEGAAASETSPAIPREERLSGSSRNYNTITENNENHTATPSDGLAATVVVTAEIYDIDIGEEEQDCDSEQEIV
jgi:hypothetical protein